MDDRRRPQHQSRGTAADRSLNASRAPSWRRDAVAYRGKIGQTPPGGPRFTIGNSAISKAGRVQRLNRPKWGRAHLLVAVAHYVDHIAIRGADEESPHAPGLVRKWVNDLVPTPLRLGVRLINTGADVHRDDRVMRRRRVAGD